jgi:hypothetical protein
MPAFWRAEEVNREVTVKEMNFCPCSIKRDQRQVATAKTRSRDYRILFKHEVTTMQSGGSISSDTAKSPRPSLSLPKRPQPLAQTSKSSLLTASSIALSMLSLFELHNTTDSVG